MFESANVMKYWRKGYKLGEDYKDITAPCDVRY